MRPRSRRAGCVRLAPSAAAASGSDPYRRAGGRARRRRLDHLERVPAVAAAQFGPGPSEVGELALVRARNIERQPLADERIGGVGHDPEHGGDLLGASRLIGGGEGAEDRQHLDLVRVGGERHPDSAVAHCVDPQLPAGGLDGEHTGHSLQLLGDGGRLRLDLAAGEAAGEGEGEHRAREEQAQGSDRTHSHNVSIRGTTRRPPASRAATLEIAPIGGAYCSVLRRHHLSARPLSRRSRTPGCAHRRTRRR